MVAELDVVFVELYLRCKSNPMFFLPGGFDAARVFVVDMESKLALLTDRSRRMLLLRAEGENERRIAAHLAMSPRTVMRDLKKIELMPRSWENTEEISGFWSSPS